ncbi:MAG TPA: acyl-CoA dehydrogenase [Anaeromyxobacteraceae bacterium]|nr:acyl-CoA dehydrogenase [Anaeromyxobacteraceae bacterium]
MAEAQNPLVSDRDVEFVLHEVLDVTSLCRLPYFRDHSRETFDLYLSAARRLAREVLFPSYRAVDRDPPVLKDGKVTVHPLLHEIHPRLVALGLIAAARPAEVGGQQLPLSVATAAELYLMAGNLSAVSYSGLTAGAAHLLESFGSEALQRDYMEPMYRGEWTGTMALTEPQAGSSLADVTTRARPAGDHWLIEGSKIFISGGDHDLAENVVHLVLARIEGAPAGVKGISLFCVPKLRREGGRLVGNDVQVAGLIHKIGWRGLPSLAMSFGEAGDCRGWLVGQPNQGLSHMFQMMNEARLMVGCHGVATASVAYHESRLYALARPQGRPLASRDPSRPQVPIVEHADVRRMLLRQKAIVEGGLSLLVSAALQADLARHAEDQGARQRAQRLLDVLTPVAKSFPAEAGFESNALALQIHGGYGYSSEYLPEAWLRDQKLNSIHEGTTGIQGLDLLGRRAVAEGGAGLRALLEEIAAAARRARKAGVEASWAGSVEAAGARLAEVTMQLGAQGLEGRAEEMLRHSADYLRAFSILAVAWQWLWQAAAAREGLARDAAWADFYQGKLRAAQYFLATELPEALRLLDLCASGEDSYARMRPEWF